MPPSGIEELQECVERHRPMMYNKSPCCPCDCVSSEAAGEECSADEKQDPVPPTE